MSEIYILGKNCKLYYGEAGSPANILINNIEDVTVSLERGETDVTTRGSGEFEEKAAVLISGSIDFKMIWDPEDAAFTALQQAFFQNSPIAIYAKDGEGGKGLDADCIVFKFSRSESLREAITVDVTVKPTRSTRAPQWH